MAYNPSSFNYTPRDPATFGGGGAAGGITPQFQEFAKWIAQQGIDMFNLARADRNTQLQIANAFQQQQADQALAQQQFQNRLTTQTTQQGLDAARQRAYQEKLASNLALGGGIQALVGSRPAANFKREIGSNISGSPYEYWAPTDEFLASFQPPFANSKK